MKKDSKFQKGSGCYKCKCCGRKTRATGNNDNEHVGLCLECYEMGGIDNMISDGNFEDEAGKESLIGELKYLASIIKEKGGVPSSEYI